MNKKNCNTCFWWNNNKYGCQNSNWMDGLNKPEKPSCDNGTILLGYKEKKEIKNEK